MLLGGQFHLLLSLLANTISLPGTRKIYHTTKLSQLVITAGLLISLELTG